MYAVSNIWEKNLKRAKKITGKCIGSITPYGIIPSKSIVQNLNQIGPLSVKVYGPYIFMLTEFKEWLPVLQKNFPNNWKQIIVLTSIRLFYQSPIKNIPFFV